MIKMKEARPPEAGKLLVSPFGTKMKNSILRLKSAGEPSQRASQ